MTLFHLWSHAVGSVWTIWAQLDGWQFEAMEWQFVLCVLIPTSIEVGVGGLQLKKYLDEKMRPRADASAGPPSLRTLAMLRFLLILIGIVVFCAGLFVMAPHAHKDRTKHDRDNDKWETPAEGSVVWLLARLGDYGGRFGVWWFGDVCAQSLDGQPP